VTAINQSAMHVERIRTARD